MGLMTPAPEKFTATKPPETKPQGTNHIKALARNLWRIIKKIWKYPVFILHSTLKIT
jgi:hypothetical protein